MPGKGDPRRAARRRHHWRRMLPAEGVGRIIRRARRQAAAQGSQEQVEALPGYFVRNIPRMMHGSFRKQCMFIGSGVIEAGCRTLIGSRCKRSGMFWSQPGLNNIIACAAPMRETAPPSSGGTAWPPAPPPVTPGSSNPPPEPDFCHAPDCRYTYSASGSGMWQDADAIQAGAGGELVFTDLCDPGVTRRFYRVRLTSEWQGREAMSRGCAQCQAALG